MTRRTLPPAPPFDDLPAWEHNFDNVRVRSVNIAWNLLLTRDVSQISFRELTDTIGVTPAAIYAHFPTPNDLADELALQSFNTLSSEIDAFLAPRKVSRPLHGLRFVLDFARQRPHHFALMLSPRFNRPHLLADVRKQLDALLELFLEKLLRRPPRKEEALALLALVYGGGLRIAHGTASVNEILALISQTASGWRRAQRTRP